MEAEMGLGVDLDVEMVTRTGVEMGIELEMETELEMGLGVDLNLVSGVGMNGLRRQLRLITNWTRLWWWVYRRVV
jgi:hypothetical protein